PPWPARPPPAPAPAGAPRPWPGRPPPLAPGRPQPPRTPPRRPPHLDRAHSHEPSFWLGGVWTSHAFDLVVRDRPQHPPACSSPFSSAATRGRRPGRSQLLLAFSGNAEQPILPTNEPLKWAKSGIRSRRAARALGQPGRLNSPFFRLHRCARSPPDVLVRHQISRE